MPIINTRTLLIFASLLSICLCKGVPPKLGKCPPGYTIFNRIGSRHPWCMRIFNDANLTFFEAEHVCRCQGGATLSAISSTDEHNWLKEEKNNMGLIKDIWVGAYHRQQCWRKDCTTDTRYRITDKKTPGTYLFNLWKSGVDFSNKRKNCAIISSTNGSMSLNVAECEVKSADGFLCGRPAKIEKNGNVYDPSFIERNKQTSTSLMGGLHDSMFSMLGL